MRIITAKLNRPIYESNNYRHGIYEGQEFGTGERITIVVKSKSRDLPDELPDKHFDFKGRWDNHPRLGRRFISTTYRRTMRVDRFAHLHTAA